MKRTRKQIGSLFMAVVMVLTMLPLTAFAETGEVDSGIPLLDASGTITVTETVAPLSAAQNLTVQGGNGAEGTGAGPGAKGADDIQSLSDTEFDSISVISGNGGDSGGGNNGGTGGDAKLTLTAETVTVAGSIDVRTGADGDGNTGAWCGKPELWVNGTLIAPSITVTSTQNNADYLVNINTLNVSTGTSITVSGINAPINFTIHTVNIADGKTLTINNAGGALYIGEINFTGSGTGRVVIEDSSRMFMRGLNFLHNGDYNIPASTIGVPISDIDVSGGVIKGSTVTTLYNFSAVGLPEGISINPNTGVISGTPTTAGAAGTATITVTDNDDPPTSKSITISYGAISGGGTPSPVFFDAETATFDLENLPSGDASGGSGNTVWSWNFDKKELILDGAGPYTLKGTATETMCVAANNAVELTLNGASFTGNTNKIALYLSKGGTLRVTAYSQVTGGIDANLSSLAIALDDADLDVGDSWTAISALGLSLTGSGTVTAVSSDMAAVICVGNLTVETGCTLSASGTVGLNFQNSFSGDAPIISGGGNIIAAGNTHYGIVGNSFTGSLTFAFTGDLEITGATYGIDMQKTDTATAVIFDSAPRSLTINSGSGIIGSSQGGTVALQNTANIPGLTEAFNAGGTRFPGTPVSANLEVLGVAVNNTNKDKITGPGISGGVSYDPATKTLTLNNAVIAPSAPAEHGIFSADDLTIHLIGQNQIGTVTGNPARQDAYMIQVGISGGKSVSLTGDGNLTVYDGVTGILANNSLTVALGGSLTVVEYGFGGMACCLRTDGPLTINSGNLKLTSYNSKGMKGGNIVINGGVISAQTQGNSGHFAFNTAPTFGGSYDHQVFAGENATLAVEITSPTAATFTSSKYVRIQPQGAKVYTVTFNANGGSVSPTSGITGTDGKLSSLPTPNIGGNYRFDGWFTSASDGTIVTTNTVFTSHDTIYAHWTYTGGGGGDGGGSTGGSSGDTTNPTATMPENKPGQPMTATASVTAAAGKNGTASAAISDKSITDAIAKAQADAKAQGKTANGISVGLDITMPKGATALTATLTQSSLNSLVSTGVSRLALDGAPVSLGLDLNALKEIQKQSNSNISITIAPATGLPEEAQVLLGNRPVYNITISYVKDGKTMDITSLGNGAATLSIPYTPGKNEAVGYLFGVYVDANGKAQRIPGSAYDVNSGSLLIPTGHFSVYGVGYTAPSAKFTDIGTHWGKEAIDYVVGRGLLSGTSETTFAPDTAMTRGMLVTALGRLAGVDANAYTGSSFTDVKADSAFHPYIEWAYKKGIVQGIGNQQFAPDRAITREEIAVIFANYAKATGYKLPVTREAAAYADASNIGSSYKTAVTAMQQAGIMMGGTDNRFNPKSNATRAEVSSMLHRYIRMTIEPATAQGWTENDAGQYLCYKDGKALTGTQTIDGVKYFFETTGVLKSGWVKDGDNWRYYSGNQVMVGFWDIGSDSAKKTYYFTGDGLMVSGKWLEIDGNWYYFFIDGALAKSTKVDGYEVDKNGVRKTN